MVDAERTVDGATADGWARAANLDVEDLQPSVTGSLTAPEDDVLLGIVLDCEDRRLEIEEEGGLNVVSRVYPPTVERFVGVDDLRPHMEWLMGIATKERVKRG